MVWFKVDDKLHDHRKTRKVRKSSDAKNRDVAPFGIWTLAGSWCGSNKTGGFIPLEVIEEWDDDAEELADRLVDAGLWHPDEVDGEFGYRFHDWADQNPGDGEDSGDYGRRGNHIRWHEKRGTIDPDCVFCCPPTTSDDPPDIAPDHRGDSGGESSRPDPTRPDPTRPDPTRTRPEKTVALRAANLDTDPDFIAFWAAYPRREAKGNARRAWLKALKTNTPPARIITAAQRYAQKVAKADPKFTAMPASWLNGERWLDEDPAAGTIPFPKDGTQAEKDAWVAAQPLPTDGAYYGGSRR